MAASCWVRICGERGGVTLGEEDGLRPREQEGAGGGVGESVGSKRWREFWRMEGDRVPEFDETFNQ